MILEGIVTSTDSAGQINIAPMGPLVEPEMDVLRLRPFKTSHTYQNLKQHGQGVFHVIDDVLLLARAAIGELDQLPELFPAQKIKGQVLKSACRWYEFEVVELDDSQDRADILAKVVHMGRLNDFFGFNRAKHAVLEAAIIATRVHLMTREQIKNEFDRLQIPVQKTAGPKEIEAFGLLHDFVNRK
ncbi:MAG: hypothetical protein JWM11_1171 [Planctomycetaceae bacterium]|nr:hypothetical protein [Planctomycetaceae bacterium]